MTIKKQSDGKWLVDIYPEGRDGKRIRKKFPSKTEAVRYERWVMQQDAATAPWNQTARADTRTLDDLIDLWFDSHGHTLSDGRSRVMKLKKISAAMGHPCGRDVDEKMFSNYRMLRTTEKGVALGIKQIKPKTANNELTYLYAVYNELHNLKLINYESPLSNVKRLKVVTPEMSFLNENEIVELFSELEREPEDDARLISELCLRTGARWGEAQGVKPAHLFDGDVCKVHYTYTKGNRARAVSVDRVFFDKLMSKATCNNQPIFQPSYDSFSDALNRTNIVLPKGQRTHVLRHTFASTFMRNGGDILILKEILGHRDIAQTMKYAHFSPRHLNDILMFNPLAKVST